MTSKLSTIIILLTVITAETGKLVQIFEGTLTEIICSTTVPSFLINGIYTSQHYNQLLGLFGIKARVAPDRSNVILHINGTPQADNVTIECQNIIDLVTGHTETLFRFTTVFVDTLPSPINIHLNVSTLLWAPPVQFQSPPNMSTIRVNPRIVHYMVYITDLSTDYKINVSSPHPNFTFPCTYSIQVSAVNSAGEGERSNTTIINNCADTDAVADKNGQTVMEKSDYNRNQTFGVHDQVITPGGSNYEQPEDKMEKLHSETLTVMIGTVALTGSVAAVSLFFNCVLLILLIKKLRNQKSKNEHPGEKYEEKVIMEQNEAYACAASLNRTYANICAHRYH